MEVRTTIMLRNLPNHLGFQDLKEIIDQVCFGRYDFFYLRIDFRTNKNVGYAFVNFNNVMEVVRFLEYWLGHAWVEGIPRFAEMSFAALQGLDCCQEKFRNSVVMLENPNFRPKLWYTHETAPEPSMVGTEMAFPPPNNLAKMQRSRDNAGQIGLYASGSRHLRGTPAGRNRRSQYDRGTPAHLQEEAYFNSLEDQAFMYPQGNYPPVMMMGGQRSFQPVASAYYGTPYHNGAQQFNDPGYAVVPFQGSFNGSQTRRNNQFNGGQAYPNGQFNGGQAQYNSTYTPRRRGGPYANLARPNHDVTVVAPTNGRNAAMDRYNQGGPVQSPTGNYQVSPYADHIGRYQNLAIPKAIAEESEDGSAVGHTPQYSNKRYTRWTKDGERPRYARF